MDWSTVLSSEAEDVEKNEELLERLYGFFLQTDLPQQGSHGLQTEREPPSFKLCLPPSITPRFFRVGTR